MTEMLEAVEVLEIQASPDTGNSSTKVIFDIKGVKLPRRQPTLIATLSTLPKFEPAPVQELVNNLHKKMVINVASAALKRNGLFAVGEASEIHGGDGFDIDRYNKAESDLSIIQPLAMIATHAIQHVVVDDELPSLLHVEVKYTAAIPVLEYKKQRALELKSRLEDTHIVTVHVGEGLQTTVRIKITEAVILQEGIPAFYAILNAKPEVFENYNKKYNSIFTGKDFSKRKLLLVDIGEGTVELIYILDGAPVSDKSTGFKAGTGYAVNKANEAYMEEMNIPVKLSRQQFMEKFVNPSAKFHKVAVSSMETPVKEQIEVISATVIKHIESKLISEVDDIVVFGGGTNIFTELKDVLEQYGEKYEHNVLWIDGQQSALLNALGLDILATKVYFKKE